MNITINLIGFHKILESLCAMYFFFFFQLFEGYYVANFNVSWMISERDRIVSVYIRMRIWISELIQRGQYCILIFVILSLKLWWRRMIDVDVVGEVGRHNLILKHSKCTSAGIGGESTWPLIWLTLPFT